MKKSQPAAATRLYTPRATICALGLKVRSLKLFDTISEHVRIRQKTIRHTPIFWAKPKVTTSATDNSNYYGFIRTFGDGDAATRPSYEKC